jgi:hypothetical protein
MSQIHPFQDKEQDRITEFADNVITDVEFLFTIGKSYRKKIYKLGDIVKYFIDNMKIKNANLGNKYLEKMVINIETIFRNASRYSKYDTLEFINSIIKYGLKMISYKYTKDKIEPTLPDYTLAEIQDAAFEKAAPKL